MKRITTGSYLHHGWTILRGGYVDTCDDRIDGWYIDPPDTDYWDRRGPGYRTLRDACEAIDASRKERAWLVSTTSSY